MRAPLHMSQSWSSGFSQRICSAILGCAVRPRPHFPWSALRSRSDQAIGVERRLTMPLSRICCSCSRPFVFALVGCSAAIRRVSEVKQTRRRHHLRPGLTPSEIETLPCRSAGVIPGQTSFANVGPRAVDRTRRRDADVPNKGRAAIAVAPHSSLIVINERARDPLKRRVILQ